MTLFISRASRCTPGREGDERHGDDVRAMKIDVVQGDGMCSRFFTFHCVKVGAVASVVFLAHSFAEPST